MVEGVSPISETVVSNFASHFKACNFERPSMDNLQFRTLSFLEGGSLT